MNVKIAGIVRESVVDGPGMRTTIFFQGCRHACHGCHNPQTWDVNGGTEYAVEEMLPQLKLTPLIQGVTFSGGEPFLQAKAAAHLAQMVKRLGLSLWIYTGYRWEELLVRMHRPGFRQLLSFTDVVVDGPFEHQLKTLAVPFRGSSNQRLIAVEETLAMGRIVEWQPEKVAKWI